MTPADDVVESRFVSPVTNRSESQVPFRVLHEAYQFLTRRIKKHLREVKDLYGQLQFFKFLKFLQKYKEMGGIALQIETSLNRRKTLSLAAASKSEC